MRWIGAGGRVRVRSWGLSGHADIAVDCVDDLLERIEPLLPYKEGTVKRAALFHNRWQRSVRIFRRQLQSVQSTP